MRVLVVDDCRLRREYLVAQFVGHATEVSECWNPDSFWADMAEHQPQVLLINRATRGSDQLACQIIESGLASSMLVFGLTQNDEDAIVELAEAGVLGYHLRSESLEELLTFIGRVAIGEAGCSPGVSAILLRRLSRLSTRRHSVPESALLTLRETEILRMLEEGLSNQEIAVRLMIATHTVKNHVHKVLNKLGARSRSEAAAIARTMSSLES